RADRGGHARSVGCLSSARRASLEQRFQVAHNLDTYRRAVALRAEPIAHSADCARDRHDERGTCPPPNASDDDERSRSGSLLPCPSNPGATSAGARSPASSAVSPPPPS